MSVLLRRTALAFALVMVPGSFMASGSFAQNLQLDLSGKKPQLRVQDPEDEVVQRDRDRDRRRPGCSADDALDKAEDLGLRRARVIDQDRESITVRGERRSKRTTVEFARDRRCSIID